MSPVVQAALVFTVLGVIIGFCGCWWWRLGREDDRYEEGLRDGRSDPGGRRARPRKAKPKPPAAIVTGGPVPAAIRAYYAEGDLPVRERLSALGWSVASDPPHERISA